MKLISGLVLIGAAALMAVLLHSKLHSVTVKTVRDDLYGVRYGYLCVFPQSSHLTQQIATALPKGEMAAQRLKIKACDQEYTNCCNKYIDGAWAYAAVDENNALCTLVNSREILTKNRKDICIRASDLIVNEDPIGTFAIEAKGGNQ